MCTEQDIAKVFVRLRSESSRKANTIGLYLSFIGFIPIAILIGFWDWIKGK